MSIFKKMLIVFVLVLSFAAISQAVLIHEGPTTVDGSNANKVEVLPTENWDGEFWSRADLRFMVTWELDILTDPNIHTQPTAKAAIMMFGPTGVANTHISGNKILMMQPDGTLTIAGVDLANTPQLLTAYKTVAAINDGKTHHVKVVFDILVGLDVCTIFIDGENSLEITTHNLNPAVVDNGILNMSSPGMVLGYNEKATNATAWHEFAGVLSNVEVTYDNFNIGEPSKTDLYVGENGISDSFEVTLAHAFTETVIVTVDPNGLINSEDIQLEGTSNPGDALVLTFAPGDVGPKTVVVNAVDDEEEELLESVTLAITSDAGTINSVSVFVVDNDTVALGTFGVTTMELSEGGPADSFDIRVGKALQNEMTILMANLDPEDMEVQFIDPATSNAVDSLEIVLPIGFTGDYDVEVIAIDDLQEENRDKPGTPQAPGQHDAIITFNVATVDANYTGMTITNKTAKVTDNDCGAIGFLAMDFNQDCFVDLADFVVFASEWMNDTLPANQL
ncbi:MAG: hypothetical protein JEZ07_17975 [Phycisphaerae bacterium]|nr:hypothetical protein [Phycisphaerae bacterium]